MVAKLDFRNTVADCHHHAGDFQPRNIGRPGRRRIIAAALHYVGKIDAGRHYLDKNFAVAGRRHRADTRFESLGPARVDYLDCGHFGRNFCRHGALG